MFSLITALAVLYNSPPTVVSFASPPYNAPSPTPTKPAPVKQEPTEKLLQKLTLRHWLRTKFLHFNVDHLTVWPRRQVITRALFSAGTLKIHCHLPLFYIMYGLPLTMATLDGALEDETGCIQHDLKALPICRLHWWICDDHSPLEIKKEQEKTTFHHTPRVICSLHCAVHTSFHVAHRLVNRLACMVPNGVL